MIKCIGQGRRLMPHSYKHIHRQIQNTICKSHLFSGIQGRCLTTKNPPSGSAKLPRTLSEPPKIELDIRKSSVLHEKAARAAELHAELNVLLDKQSQRRSEELNRPFGAGFIQFMKNSKSEMINIFAAFMCVVLAYQIAVIRRGAKLLVEQAEEREKVVDDLKQVLRTMSSSNFSDRVAEKCINAVNTSNSEVINTPTQQKKSLLSWFSSSQTESSMESSLHDRGSVIGKVLKSEIQKIVGDIALTDSEIADKRMKELKAEMNHREKMLNENNSVKPDNSLLGADELISEIQSGIQSGIQSDSEQVVVKRKKGFI